VAGGLAGLGEEAVPEGVRLAAASPPTTAARPFIRARKPWRATSSRLFFFMSGPKAVLFMPARVWKLLSVAPGMRQVTVTPCSLSSSRSPRANMDTTQPPPDEAAERGSRRA
jgi:hypothetical protein